MHWAAIVRGTPSYAAGRGVLDNSILLIKRFFCLMKFMVRRGCLIPSYLHRWHRCQLLRLFDAFATRKQRVEVRCTTLSLGFFPDYWQFRKHTFFLIWKCSWSYCFQIPLLCDRRFHRVAHKSTYDISIESMFVGDRIARRSKSRLYSWPLVLCLFLVAAIWPIILQLHIYR